MSNKVTLPKETIEGWKKKYGTIHEIRVVVKPETPDNEADEAVGYIKDANENMDLIANVLSLQVQHRILEAKIMLLDNTWLGGDPRIFGENAVTSVKIGAATAAAQTIEILKGNIVKL